MQYNDWEYKNLLKDMLYNNCIAGDLVGTAHCNIMIENILEIAME